MTKDECGTLTYALDRDRIDLEGIASVVRSQRKRGRVIYPLREFAAAYDRDDRAGMVVAAHRLRASTGFAPWERALESKEWLERRT